jgi:hypothetical protein
MSSIGSVSAALSPPPNDRPLPEPPLQPINEPKARVRAITVTTAQTARIVFIHLIVVCKSGECKGWVFARVFPNPDTGNFGISPELTRGSGIDIYRKGAVIEPLRLALVAQQDRATVS